MYEIVFHNGSHALYINLNDTQSPHVPLGYSGRKAAAWVARRIYLLGHFRVRRVG